MSQTDNMPESGRGPRATYRGRPESPEVLFGLVYNELRRVARASCRGSEPTTLYKPLHWSTKLISGSSTANRFNGKIASTCFVRLPEASGGS